MLSKTIRKSWRFKNKWVLWCDNTTVTVWLVWFRHKTTWLGLGKEHCLGRNKNVAKISIIKISWVGLKWLICQGKGTFIVTVTLINMWLRLGNNRGQALKDNNDFWLETGNKQRPVFCLPSHPSLCFRALTDAGLGRTDSPVQLLRPGVKWVQTFLSRCYTTCWHSRCTDNIWMFLHLPNWYQLE